MTALKEVLAAIAALPTIMPSEASPDEQYNWNVPCVSLSSVEAILRANGPELLAMEGERDRYRAAIVEHNSDYGACNRVKCGYAPYKYRECPECPAQHLIDLAAIDASLGAGKGRE